MEENIMTENAAPVSAESAGERDFASEIRALAERYPELLEEEPGDEIIALAAGGMSLGEAFLTARLERQKAEMNEIAAQRDALLEEKKTAEMARVSSAADSPDPGEGEDLFLMGFELG